MNQTRERDAYVAGVATGVGGSCTAALVWLGWRLGELRTVLDDFGGAVPAPTAIAMHPLVRVGAPVALALALGLLQSRTPRPRALSIVALIALALLSLSHVAAELPFHQLSDSIAD